MALLNGLSKHTQLTFEETSAKTLQPADPPKPGVGVAVRPIRLRGAQEAKTRSEQEKKRSHLERWFANQPVGRKQLLALLLCELVPLVGLGGGATWILTQSLRQQLAEQAKAQVQVTDIQYNIKIDQMGFGSRGQADNTALINAALTHKEGGTMEPEAAVRVKQILSNEVQARRMEYATLVGADLKIVANANRDQTNEIFDPNGLVSAVLKQGRQVKASEIISWSELQKEGAPLPQGVKQANVLIRYVVTPVFDPLNPTVTIGALVFGDIVNGKPTIPGQVLSAFDSGYSAVYQRNRKGEFELASSLRILGDEGLAGAASGLRLENEALLQQAAAQPQKTLTQRLKVGDRTYTVAARSGPSRIYTDAERGKIPIYSDDSRVVLVHGTPETGLNALLNRSLTQVLLVALLSLGLLGLWNRLFRRTLLKPLLSLEAATQEFAEGDRQRRAEVYSVDEVGQLAMTFNGMADNIVESEASLAAEAQRQQAQAYLSRQLTEITVAMRATSDKAQVFEAAVSGVRQTLEADRAVVYRFEADYRGSIAAESVLPQWNSVVGTAMADPCFAEQYVEPYRQGRVHVVTDMRQAEIQDCYRAELEPFQIQANLVAPIVVNEQLLGLLGVHQCDRPREWQEREVNFVRQTALQLGYALEQAELAQAQEQARRDAEASSEKERQQNLALQMQLVELLSDVENVADGDLTVRANVTEGAIGTVADFFNSIVESLRQVVTQVKDSATQVNQSVGESGSEIRQLAAESLRQSDEITSAVSSIERMTQSIQAVATSARQAAEVSQTAADTAAASGVAMDRTVENILTLRETIGETAKKVKRLGESSQQISKVVYLINQIAMQTNLLAINAGIEAARAGEQGQGFAVVAEEVGELAARSASATQEIEQIVETIQRETSEVVQAMELGTAQVVEGTHLVEDAKLNLGQIVTVSREIDELVKSISVATVSQADTSSSITELMQKLSAIAQRTSASSTEVSDSLKATMGVTEQLQASVGTFKVA